MCSCESRSAGGLASAPEEREHENSDDCDSDNEHRKLRFCIGRSPGGSLLRLRTQAYAGPRILAIDFHKCSTTVMSRDWGFLTNHGRVLVCIAHDPGARLRDIAAELAITERTAYGIVTDLTEAGYVVKEKDGRRNRYEVQGHLPLRDAVTRERTVGEVLSLLVKSKARRKRR